MQCTYSFEHENKPEREPLLAAADLLRELRSLAQPLLDTTIYQAYALLSDTEGNNSISYALTCNCVIVSLFCLYTEQCLATGVTAPKVNALITKTCR